MARSRKSLNIKSLKKTTRGTYYDAKSRQEFSKTKKGYNMVVGKYESNEHRKNVRRLEKLNKKYGGAFSKELKQENENWNEYKKSIKEFNKGNISRATTVKRRYTEWNTSSLRQEKTYTNEKRISSIVSDKKKVTLMRMSGKHGIYNGKAYDDYISMMADEFGMETDEIEPLLFPTANDDEIKYEEYKSTFSSNKTKTIFDVIDEKEKSGEFNENKAIRMQNLAMLGE